jgi:hypothetical protein
MPVYGFAFLVNRTRLMPKLWDTFLGPTRSQVQRGEHAAARRSNRREFHRSAAEAKPRSLCQGFHRRYSGLTDASRLARPIAR